jgi:putative oxidoreductase
MTSLFNDKLVPLWFRITDCLDAAGTWLALLGLRALLAWEFWESGVEKYKGENWFAEIQDRFPFPFDLLPVDFSWWLSTWVELIGAWLLLFGLGTRIISAKLIVLTLVAWAAVHAGNGYNVCDNGFKLPLIYLVMFVPLLLMGPGKLSLDHLIAQRFRGSRAA